jgi:hypothetical protein
MNVLNLVRQQAVKKQALQDAQMAATKAAPIFLTYRGQSYQKAA